MQSPNYRSQKISADETIDNEQASTAQKKTSQKCKYFIYTLGLLQLIIIAFYMHSIFVTNEMILETKLKQFETMMDKTKKVQSTDTSASSNWKQNKISQEIETLQQTLAVTQKIDSKNMNQLGVLKQEIASLKKKMSKYEEEEKKISDSLKSHVDEQEKIKAKYQAEAKKEEKTVVKVQEKKEEKKKVEKVQEKKQISTNQEKPMNPPTLPISIPKVNDGSHPPGSQHSHQHLKFSYRTMGIRQIGKQFNFTVIPQNKYYEYEAKMDQVFKPYKDTNCEFQRYGDKNDGGYVMCKNFAKDSVALVNLGVEGRDNFGCGLTSQFKYPNYQYDCTNKKAPSCETNNNKNKFQFACLGQSTQQTQTGSYYSLKDIVDKNDLFHKRVTMKIDIEGGQWPGFRSFPIDYLDYVDQFILEIHNPGPYKQGIFYGNLDIIQSLKEKFVSVNLHMNNYGNLPRQQITSKSRFYQSHAIEVTLVNKKLIKLNSNARSYALHPKNTANNPRDTDYQMQD